MNKAPLFQKVLGNEWDNLPPVIQQHYRLPSVQVLQNSVAGVMFIEYPRFVTPILKIVRFFGGLIDLKGPNMAVKVEKRVNQDMPDCLFWRREIKSPGGKIIVFASRMEYQKTNELIEYIGGGFGIHLKVNCEDGKLVYRSNGHLWQIGKFKIPIPDVLFLGHATITETAVSEDEFRLDFKISHPLFGDTYRYGGLFKITPPS
jgi:hypothetical protein